MSRSAQLKEFSKILEKWRRYMTSTASKIANVTGAAFEDVMQDVQLTAWQAFVVYHTTQFRIDRKLWDLQGTYPFGYVVTRKGVTKKIPYALARKVDKRLSPASFIFLRIKQWKKNVLAAHFSEKHGYVKLDEQPHRHRRCVVEYCLDDVVERSKHAPAEHDWSIVNLRAENDVIFHAGLCETRERLDTLGCQVFDLILSAHTVSDCPRASATAFISHSLGISQIAARGALRDVLGRVPGLAEYEVMHTENGRRQITRPVQDVLQRKPCATHGSALQA